MKFNRMEAKRSKNYEKNIFPVKYNYTLYPHANLANK